MHHLKKVLMRIVFWNGSKLKEIIDRVKQRCFDKFSISAAHKELLLFWCAAGIDRNRVYIYDVCILTLLFLHNIMMVTMLYKIKHSLAPDYLTSLLPRQNSEVITHNLRNREYIKPPHARLETYKRSFFPSAINIWNSLTSNTWNMPTVQLFKQALTNMETNILYYYGKRWASIHHARIRMGCSLLNYDLCYRVYVTDNPACRCGASMETAFHFFMECPLYQLERENMVNAIVPYANCTLQVILRGSEVVNLETNKLIFDAVHTFIYQSSRFRWFFFSHFHSACSHLQL